MTGGFSFAVDRLASASLTQQISSTLRSAILDGRIAQGARLPSWRDLAAQLGVARGTVRAAYERLVDEMLVEGAGPAGTRVIFARSSPPTLNAIPQPSEGMIDAFSATPLPFQMGVPAQDAFPALLWARLRARAVRDDALASTSYADPRGEPQLRIEIASYVAIARGIHCHPDQVLITGGYRSGLGLALKALGLSNGDALMEDPGFPLTRTGVVLAGLTPVAVPVDEQGMDVARGRAMASEACVAVVTAGQQAPLGIPLSPDRRKQLLDWASAGRWIIEDDYLSELQLDGRPAPAMASTDPHGRVIHLGTFSKTLSPSLGLGFVVVPEALAGHFAAVAASLAPAPNAVTQSALAVFLADGHYLRHLRRMKKLYAGRRDALRARLHVTGVSDVMAGLALLLPLPSGVDDVAIARAARAAGLSPVPLSPWYAGPKQATKGLLLGVTNLTDAVLEGACDRLERVLRAAS